MICSLQARKKFQNEQARNWHEAQMREKAQAKRNQEAADQLYDLKQKELDQRAMDLQSAEENCRKAINMAQAAYNDALVSFVYCLGQFFLIIQYLIVFNPKNIA